MELREELVVELDPLAGSPERTPKPRLRRLHRRHHVRLPEQAPGHADVLRRERRQRDELPLRSRFAPAGQGLLPFYAWSKLRDAGTHVEARVDWDPHIPRGDVVETDRDDTYAAAAVSQDGRRGAVMVARYHTDMNVTWDRTVRIRLADGTPIPHPRYHLTDTWRTYTEVTPEVDSDGSIIVPLEPRSFALVEW